MHLRHCEFFMSAFEGKKNLESLIFYNFSVAPRGLYHTFDSRFQDRNCDRSQKKIAIDRKSIAKKNAMRSQVKLRLIAFFFAIRIEKLRSQKKLRSIAVFFAIEIRIAIDCDRNDRKNNCDQSKVCTRPALKHGPAVPV